jgi:hypothetical protein
MNKTEQKQITEIESTYESLKAFIDLVKASKYGKTEEQRLSAETSAYYSRAWLEALGVSEVLLDAIESEVI